METSNILSRFIIGENQLSLKYLGYEITKKVLAILSPRLRDFGVICIAEGAMMSCNSSVAALYISFGKIGMTIFWSSGCDDFLLNKEKIPIPYCNFIPWLMSPGLNVL